MRRLELATPDLFDELGGPPPSRLQNGLSADEAMKPSQLISSTMEQTLVWLHRRQTAHEIFDRIVAGAERVLARAGRRERQPIEPPAVAFVDLAGYTELAATAGDQHAAEAATLLHSLAVEAARDHEGRVVKLLGDGVLLRYASARAAISSVCEHMTRIGEAGLPGAHAGIASGPIVSRDGDVYGHTVNLASRISGQASVDEVLVPAELAEDATRAGYAWEDAGEASLRGLIERVRLARVRRRRALSSS